MGLIGHNLSCVRNDKIIFKNLSFTLEKGSTLLLHGSNGSGKSSLLRIIAGLSEPADGLLIWSSDIPYTAINYKDYLSKSSSIHYLTAFDGMKTDLSVLENLYFWASLYPHTNIKYPNYFFHIIKMYSEKSDLNLFNYNPYLRGVVGNTEVINYVLQALEKVNLLQFAHTKVNLLSSGQRKRLGIAKLLSIPAPLWLLDEPTLGLDKESLRLLEEAILVHQSNGGSVILASHLNINIYNAVSLKLDDYTGV